MISLMLPHHPHSPIPDLSGIRVRYFAHDRLLLLQREASDNPGAVQAAIRNCLASLAPFLRDCDGNDAQRQQDILLINEFANFTDERLIVGLKEFLDINNPSSLRLRHCGFALTAFNSEAYPADDIEGQASEIEDGIRSELAGWVNVAKRRIDSEKLSLFSPL